MSVDPSSWKIRNEQKLTWKVPETYSLPQFEKKSLKSEKKYKNHRQAEYHHALKRKKISVKCLARDSDLGPLVYEASVLPTKLSFQMKNWEKIMTIYIWFVVVQQMYVSLTYTFNIVQHTLSHIFEHRKLDSLANPDNIVRSTVTVGPTMFVNLTSALHKTYYSKHCLIIGVEISVFKPWKKNWRVSPTTLRSYLLVWMKVPYLIILKYSPRF